VTDPYRALLDDLAAEQADLDRVVGPLDDADWHRPTPAEGWDVADTISHLEWFDQAAARAAIDPEAFAAEVQLSLTDPGFMERSVVLARTTTPAEVLGAWRAGRAEVLARFGELDGSVRLPWYGPPMSAMSFATARLMECWAHGQDVVDAVGAERQPSARLRHIAHLGVRTRGFSYVARGEEPPEGDVRVELAAPDGEEWTWGDPSAADHVRGSALDFCLLVTQRRHRDDTALQAEGPLAEGWLAVAQAFAGPPGPGRQPGLAARG
jgi:uncharacterized protein (TIGR03084 family)